MTRGHLEVDGQALAAVCRRWGVDRLEIFGSALRDDFRDESDVDLLVTFAPEAETTFADLADAERELGAIFGRRVDLVSRAGVAASANYLRRKAILESAVPLYAA